MKTIQPFILSVALLFSLTLAAQDENKNREVPFQVTLIPPLGTNGIYAGNTVNQFSVNLIAGYAAGLSGFEIGGFININRDFAHGVQLGGFSNLTGGEVKGTQLAGFANFNMDKTEAAQISGFANFNKGETRGFQGAGFMNFTNGMSRVVQAAGFGNFSTELTGAQLAGFGNFASGNLNGLQLAGFGNFANNVSGAQISGFINVAKKVKGVQIGVVNFADSVKNGIPIGVLSIVKDGYREFEAGISEGFNNYAAFKIGVNQFYNIFAAGMQYLSNQFRWGFGYGLGTHLLSGENLKINLELMTWHINENVYWTNDYNDLQQVKLTFAGPVGRNVSVFAGPTLNLLVSDYDHARQNHHGSGFAPYRFVNETTGSTSLQAWIGFTAGLRIK